MCARIPILILAGIALSGCSLPATESSFDSRDPRARSSAAIRAAASGDERAVPGLISMLDSADPALRLIAGEALERITGETNGYDATASKAERDRAVENWVTWWDDRSRRASGEELD